MPLLFEDNLLDLERRELRRGLERVAVEPQVFDLLVHLVTNRDRVITRDELIATVWRGRIVSDSTLVSRINSARKAVGDTGEAQRLIRTYPRKGVRFIAAVTEKSDGDEPGHLETYGDSSPETGRGKPCLAVLPFANLGGDPEQDYFAEGITEDIITELSRNRSFLLVARSSASAFSGKRCDVRQIGQELGADYVVEGSVRRLGSNVRVTVELAETQTGRQLWAERYDRGLQDIFEVQDEITSTIAARLDPEVDIAEQDRAARKPRQTFDARDFFRLGTKKFYRASAEDNRVAQRLFHRAIELDPELAQAHAFLSYSIVLSMVYFDVAPDENRLAEAVAIGKRGVTLDDRDALVRFMYGRALLASGSYQEALEELAAALELNPSLPAVHCGLADSLACLGRIPDAMPHFQTAITLSPHDPLRWAFLSYRALAHLFAREFEEAARWAQKATRVPHCHYLGFAHRVAALGHLQRTSELQVAVAELRQIKPEFSLAFARQRLFYVKNKDQLALYVDGLQRAGIPARC